MEDREKLRNLDFDIRNRSNRHRDNIVYMNKASLKERKEKIRFLLEIDKEYKEQGRLIIETVENWDYTVEKSNKKKIKEVRNNILKGGIVGGIVGIGLISSLWIIEYIGDRENIRRGAIYQERIEIRYGK
ncbi:hypothetical protein H6G33_09900 [Calothrix sp. FACHB-1219]|uniref:hypothetical protein n=1 Tax=unclassified Calothrix TaxID=2619626 RepID=UPI0016866614|nr:MULTISPECIES: hypothetical protein [unclassified Calothrix]MBD2201659.1 hypothetical protein [Calothrix sp. FACHB-168]MBD2217345.1 hypothetical protein [Calothrix sp. FACHB-1219]